MPSPPSLNLGQPGDSPSNPSDAPSPELDALLLTARTTFAQRNIRKTADALCAAESLANHLGLHNKAAQLRKAKTILSTGGKPRLLTQASLWSLPRS